MRESGRGGPSQQAEGASLWNGRDAASGKRGEAPALRGCCQGAKAKEAGEAREGLILDLWAVGSHGGA